MDNDSKALGSSGQPKSLNSEEPNSGTMKDSLVKIRNLLLYSTLEKHEYEFIRRDIHKYNLSILNGASFVVSILLCALVIISSITGSFSNYTYFYGTCCLGMLLIFFGTLALEKSKGKNKRFWIQFCVYAFEIIALAFGFRVGVYGNLDLPAVSFISLIIITPILFIDRPIRLATFIGIACIAFLVEVHRLKPPRIATIDRWDVISFYVLSVALNTYSVRNQLLIMLQRKQIKLERDTDALTRLLSRRTVETHIQKFIEQEGSRGILMIIDIDDFKHFNDSFGHAFGDTALSYMGISILKTFRSTDMTGRIGGDEFIAFLPELSVIPVAIERAKNLLSLMHDFKLPDGTQMGGSIGIAAYPEHGRSYAELFSNADKALYESKRNGKNCYSLYSPTH